jgi:sulfatase modifying factor 1
MEAWAWAGFSQHGQAAQVPPQPGFPCLPDWVGVLSPYPPCVIPVQKAPPIILLVAGLGLYLFFPGKSPEGELQATNKSASTGPRQALQIDQEQRGLEAQPEPRLQRLSLVTTWDLPGIPFQPSEAPPGLVRIAGGTFAIGAPRDEIIALIEANQTRALASEVPQFEVQLDDFFIMPTEVTNEQYQRFVKAADAKPPLSWGLKAIEAASLFHAQETERGNKLALAKGWTPQKPTLFSRASWWESNWRDCDWEIPADQADFPVVFITYHEALAYASWAGLDLVSEYEIQATGRGSTLRNYPWGDTFDAAHAHTVESNLPDGLRVASFPSGAAWHDQKGNSIDEVEDPIPGQYSRVYDLAGGVWEWTRSPFLPHPGFAPLKVELDSGAELITASWDANERVASTGSYQLPAIAARISVRRGTPKWQAADGVGFRCSLPADSGLAMGRVVLRAANEAPESSKKYAPANTLGFYSWSSERGTAIPSTYRVITGFDALAFVPSIITAQTMADLEYMAGTDGLEVGLLFSTVPLLHPQLEPGTFRAIWFPFIEATGDSTPPAPPIASAQESLPVPSRTGHIELLDLTGKTVASFPSAPLSHVLPTEPRPSHRFVTEQQTGFAKGELVHLPIELPKSDSDFTVFSLPLTILMDRAVGIDSWYE